MVKFLTLFFLIISPSLSLDFSRPSSLQFLQQDLMPSPETLAQKSLEFGGISTELSQGAEIETSVPAEFESNTVLVTEVSDINTLLNSFEGVSIKSEETFYGGMDQIKEVLTALEEGQYVILNDEEYDWKNLNESIENAYELHEKSMVTKAIRDIEADNVMNLENQAHNFEELLEYMDTDEIVTINNNNYSYNDIEKLLQETKNRLNGDNDNKNAIKP